jgi:cell division protein FtsX
MSRLLTVLVLLVAGVIGLGFYLGWFSVSSTRTGDKVNVTVTMDQDKIQQDKEKAQKKVREVEQKVKERVSQP